MLISWRARVRNILSESTLRYLRFFRQTHTMWRGSVNWSSDARWPAYTKPKESPSPPNPLRTFFEEHKQGRGIWKWRHYFDIYDRHFNRFRGQEVHVLEIGIFSGGSLEMWKNYFGPEARIYGIDIEPACKKYEDCSTKIFIGDQGDRQFWNRIKSEIQGIDIIIDDGSHIPEQQIVTFEEMLPYLSPGGVYLCEDIPGIFNQFASYVYGFASNLNAIERYTDNRDNNERRLVCPTTSLQSAIQSIHFYPFVTVIEKTCEPISELVAPKHGTHWEPFLT
jgi:hypothetical protein